MIRFLTFIAVLTILILWYRLTTASGAPRGEPKSKIKKPREKSVNTDEFWAQVYDTDSVQEAKKIQSQFREMGIPCVLYEQGKKDVYGNALRHYGISVPRPSFERAQAILIESSS